MRAELDRAERVGCGVQGVRRMEVEDGDSRRTHFRNSTYIPSCSICMYDASVREDIYLFET